MPKFSIICFDYASIEPKCVPKFGITMCLIFVLTNRLLCLKYVPSFCFDYTSGYYLPKMSLCLIFKYFIIDII